MSVSFPIDPPPSGYSPAHGLSPVDLLAAIVDSSDDAIVSKNLKGIVTSWNAGAQRIFGYTSEEMVGQSILRLLPEDQKDEETRILARLQAGERLHHYETVRVRKDGVRIHVSLTISPIRDSNGVIVGASKIARDITEQKLATVRLAEAHDQLKRADRMKSEFISTMSHELRTPLNAIVGWVQLLKDGATPEELAEGMEIIDRNVRVQAQLINDLLDMSRIESGKMTLEIVRVDLPLIVEAALESVRAGASAKNIRLTVAFSSINGLIMADPNRLQQVLWNLLTNAIKFTSAGGRVHTIIERVNSHVEVSVSDTGIGIAPENLDSIFERFSQADSSITRRFSGLGIGLSIAKHLTELHGGRIHVRSAGLGQGATFIVQLPLQPVEIEAPVTPDLGADAGADASPETDLSTVKVLVVDDDIDSARTVQAILKRSGADVRIASSMAEALKAFSTAAPDVLLSDIGMPEHDGYELIKQIRTLPNGRRVPAIALTALARVEDRTRALRAGFQMHVAKPVDATELAAVVRNLADLKSGLP
jgi:PAS domain S-box-containing protein